MAEPINHVLREALPWREPSTVTECGRAAGKVATISRAEWFVIARDWRELQRLWRRSGSGIPPGVTPPNVCGSCWSTAERWPTWREDPVRALWREIDKHGHLSGRSPDRQRLGRELLALGALFEANPSRFTELSTPKEGLSGDVRR